MGTINFSAVLLAVFVDDILIASAGESVITPSTEVPINANQQSYVHAYPLCVFLSAH